MSKDDYKRVKDMADKLIAFINWKGATLESKKKKIIKEISLIKNYCASCVDNQSEVTKGNI